MSISTDKKKDNKSSRETGKLPLPFGRAVQDDPRLHKRIILFSVSLLTALIVSSGGIPSFKSYDEGDIARRNIKAPHDLLVEDVTSTLKKKDEAMATSLSVYDFDEKYAMDLRGRIKKSFSLMREYLVEIENNANSLGEKNKTGKLKKKKEQSGIEVRSAYLEESRKERTDAFEESLLIKTGENVFSLLEKKKFSVELENLLSESIFSVIKSGIVESKELLQPEAGKGVVIRNIGNQQERIVMKIDDFLELSEARDRVDKIVKSLTKKWRKKDLKILSDFTVALVKPTITLNKNETESRKKSAVDSISPVFFQIKEGEMLLREGERVTKEHVLKLEALSRASLNKTLYVNFLGMFLLTATLVYSLYHFSTLNITKIKPETKDLMFLGVVLIATLLIFRLSIPLTDALKESFTYIPATSYKYFLSAAASAILVRVVLNSEIAIIFSVTISLIVALMMKNSLTFGIYTLISCIVGIQMVRYCKYRGTLIKSGFYVGIVNCLMIILLSLLSDNFLDNFEPFSLLFGFAGGAIAGVVVTGLTPIVESTFSYTTNFKLLELASLDHPLLKELITRSPGTYHHSWIIGNLVETAAESIKANPLLARVSSLYHDIGKTKKPQYFFENQKSGKNPHDKLAPSLSSLILIGHVKDGIELAKEYKLGKEITDIIPQHHGTRLIRFFYQKAKDQEDPDVHSVNEKDFRYPGPKPQTKEAGLVMLADAVEAASRTIQEPTPARIKAVVKSIIGEIFADGQLDECELTLKDLNEIANSFNRILNGIFHARIDYPDTDADEKGDKKKDSNGTNKRKKEAERDKQTKNKKNSLPDSE